MKYRHLLVFLLLNCSVAQAQLRAIVKDSVTKKAVPFVNIWVEGKNIGTTSNSEGQFELMGSDTAEILVFSAIGYQTKRVQFNKAIDQVLLSPLSYQLKEVVISPPKETEDTIIGKFKRSGLNHYFGCGKIPWIVARYFPYHKSFKKYKYLNSLKFLTRCDVKKATFNIRLYTVDSLNLPGDYLYHKNIYVTAKKGKKYTKVDLSDLEIQFPTDGIFIAVEWLIIPENKYDFEYTMENSIKKLKGYSYEPSFVVVPSEDEPNDRRFIRGEWFKVPQNGEYEDYAKKYSLKYNRLAIELKLSN